MLIVFFLSLSFEKIITVYGPNTVLLWSKLINTDEDKKWHLQDVQTELLLINTVGENRIKIV